MRFLHTHLLILLFSPGLFANYINRYDRETFIETCAVLAANEMHRTGIPASITLAQAILESSWGQGKIAVEGKNFFGIKCYNNWTGPCIKAMDDEVDSSSFRIYGSIEASFKDHSDFLKNNDRYQSLFKIPVTDYRQWAYGLKSCGYATDEQYAEKLIRLVEENGLFLYDYAAPQFKVLNTTVVSEVETNEQISDALTFQQQDFKILQTPPIEQGPETFAMPAPVYRLNGHYMPSRLLNQPEDGQLAPATYSEGVRIVPLIPLPETQVKRR